MNFILFAVDKPKGLWERLILDVLGGIPNYGWRVVILIILLRLVLFPVDFFQRRTIMNNTEKMKRIKPQLEALQQQFGDDRATLSQKQMQLYRQEKYSTMSSCLPMIITMIVFITLFNGFRKISTYMNSQMLENLYATYQQYYIKADRAGGASLTLDILQAHLDERYESVARALYNNDPAKADTFDPSVYLDKALYTATQDDLGSPNINTGDEAELERIQNIINAKKAAGADAVYSRYESEKQTFLFVQNIWRQDTSQNPIPTRADVRNLYGGDAAYYDEYDDYMAKVMREYDGKWNGYFIWIILAVGISLIQQFITMRQQKGANAEMQGQQGMMKVMMWMMPVMMGVFAYTNAVSFAVYIVTNSAMGMLSNAISTAAIKGKGKAKEEKEQETVAATGVRSARDVRIATDKNKRNNKEQPRYKK